MLCYVKPNFRLHKVEPSEGTEAAEARNKHTRLAKSGMAEGTLVADSDLILLWDSILIECSNLTATCCAYL